MQTEHIRTLLISIVVGGCLTGPSIVAAQNDNDTLPEADAGECYAKVSVPAVYKTEAVNAVLKEATERISITPARYIKAEERLLVKESSTRLVPVPPVFDVIKEEKVIAPAVKTWVRNTLDSEIPASDGMMADLAEAGVDPTGVPTGLCYYEFYKPGESKTVEEKILIQDASEALAVLPAQYSESEKQVMVKASSKRLVVVPTVYETVTEKVLIEPAHSVWKRGRGLIERIDNTTGEIMCRVNVPAKYETVKKQVVKSKPTTKSVMIPAEFNAVKVQKLVQDAKEVRNPVPPKYKVVEHDVKISDGKMNWLTSARADANRYGKPTGNAVCHKETPALVEKVERKVVRTPGRFQSVEVPAEYESVTVQKLASNAKEAKTPVSAKTDTLIRRLKVSDARLEWRPVLCETNITKDIVKRIQTALNGKGYQAGVADGVLGRGTLSALEKFQEDKNLAQGGLTYTTIKALDVKL